MEFQKYFNNEGSVQTIIEMILYKHTNMNTEQFHS